MPPALLIRRNQIMLGLIIVCLVGSVYVNVFRKPAPPPAPSVSIASTPTGQAGTDPGAGGETGQGGGGEAGTGSETGQGGGGETGQGGGGETGQGGGGQTDPDTLRPVAATSSWPNTGRIRDIGNNPFTALEGSTLTPGTSPITP